MKQQFDVPTMEEKLQAAYQTIQPERAFAARLRGEMAARSEKTSPSLWRGEARFSYRLAFGVALALVFVVVVFFVGPQTLLARAMSLLGFIPGIGFVEEQSAYHLCEPVELTQNGVTTRLINAGGSGNDLHISAAMRGVRDGNFTVQIIGENGQVAQLRGGGGGGGGDTLNFDGDFSLPGNEKRWTMVITPNDASSSLKEEIRLPFELCAGVLPASGEVNPSLQGGESATPTGSNLPSEAVYYTPEDARASTQGVDMQVIQVVQDERATGIQVQTRVTSAAVDPGIPVEDFIPSVTRYFFSGEEAFPGDNIELMDERGNHYKIHDVNLLRDADNPYLSAFEFEPIHASARRMKVRIQSVDLLKEENVPFEFDPGEDPHIGQTWEMQDRPQSRYKIHGFEVAFVSAKYFLDARQVQGNDNEENVYVLEFTVKIIPPKPQVQMNCLHLTLGEGSSACQWQMEGDLATMDVVLKKALSAQKVNGTLGAFGISLRGPWEMEWDIPE